MLVRKSQISNLIKKERSRESVRCKAENNRILKRTVSDLIKNYETKLKDLKKSYDKIIKEKEKEILSLRSEIAKNHKTYQEIRNREIELDNLTSSFETILNEMGVKVQESIQPFYRTRAKVESTKRKSDNKDNKVQSIFRAIQ